VKWGIVTPYLIKVIVSKSAERAKPLLRVIWYWAFRLVLIVDSGLLPILNVISEERQTSKYVLVSV